MNDPACEFSVGTGHYAQMPGAVRLVEQITETLDKVEYLVPVMTSAALVSEHYGGYSSQGGVRWVKSSSAHCCG